MAQSAPEADVPSPPPSSINGVTLTPAGTHNLASPGWDGTTKARGQNGDLAVLDNANGRTAFVAGGARFHGLWATTAGRVCTDWGGVKVVDLNNLAAPAGIIDIVDTKGVLAGPLGNPRRGLFLKNISSSASAVDAITFTTGPSAGKDILAITTQRCEPSFFGGARIEFWDVTNRAAPAMVGVFDPQNILNPTPGGTPADGRWGIFEDIRVFSRNIGPGGSPKYYAVATTPFSIGNSHNASFAGDFRVLDISDPANPVQLNTFPNTSVSSASNNGCRTFHGGRSAAPSPDGSHAILSWYDGMQPPGSPLRPLGDANFGSANSAALFNLDLDNIPTGTPPGSTTFPKVFTPNPPVWGYPPAADGGQDANGMVEGNAADVQPFTAAGDKLMTVVSEDDVDAGITNFVIGAPASITNGVGQRACQIGVSKHVYELPGQTLSGEAVYVGRACPASQIANQTLLVEDPLLANPTGKVAVVDGGGAGFSGCDTVDKVRRLAAAGATGVLLNLGGDFLSVHIPGQDGGILAIPSVGIQLTSWNKLANYVPNRVQTSAVFPATWTRTTTTNVQSRPYSFAVTDATNASPIVISTGTAAGTAHGLTTGDKVTLANVTGNTAANGNWTVTVLSANTFSLNGSAANGIFNGGGQGILCPTADPGCAFTPRRTDLYRYLSLANGTDPAARGDVAAANRFTVSAGQTYTATNFMEVESYTSGTFRTAVVWYDAGGVALSESQIQALSAVTPRTQYTQTVTAPAGAVKASVKFEWTGGGAGTAYADTFAVNPTNMQVSIKDHPGDCAGMGVWPPADPCPTTAKAGFGAQKIVDFSQSPPAQVGTYRSPTSTVWPPPDNGLYVPSQARPFGKDLMLTAWHSDGLRVVDISNPAAPFETASFVPPAVADPSAAAGAGPSNRAGAVGTCGVVPVACMTRGISWPTKPLVTSVAVVPTGANTGIVVLSDINAGLYVLNMTVDRKNKPPADFDGNGSTDRSVYRPSTGQWFVNGGSPEVTNYGATGDLPVPADYDGGGTADKAVYRPSTGQWFVSGGSPEITNFGSPGDIPVPADYDGNGSADKAVFRPSTGQWFYQGGPPTGTVYGTNGDIPVPGDYNGDGVADIAIYRPTTGQWFTLVSGVSTLTSYGTAGDIPVPADYDADDDTDIAVYRPSTGQWFRLLNGVTSVTTYGAPGTPPAGDIPVPGDYDADGDADLAVYRQSTGQWFTLLNGVTTTIVYGAAGDMPLPLPYAIRSVYFP